MTQAGGKSLEDFHTLTPQLVVRGAAQAIEFYRQAFGARELYRNHAPDGQSVVHAELMLGDSRFFVHDEFPERGELSPLALNGSPVKLHLYVDNVNQVFERAVIAGAEVEMPLTDCHWGDRYGILKDPFGHQWSVATRIEDLGPGDIQERSREFNTQHPNWPE
jgi:PhnB protein